MKTFFTSNVWIHGIPDAHRAGNGNGQCRVVVRAKTKKRVSEIFGESLHYLNTYAGLQAVTGDKWDEIGVPDDSEFYQPGCTREGWVHTWFPIPTNTKSPSVDEKGRQ